MRGDDGIPAEIRDELVRRCLPPHIRDGLPHISEQVSELLMPLDEAAMKAARLGRVLWLEELLDNRGCWASAATAMAAAVNGHVEAVEMVFARVLHRSTERRMAWEVLEGSAAYGHLQVVKFVAGDIQTYSCMHLSDPFWEQCGALSAAIHGGYLAVVEFLLDARYVRWDYPKYFAQAVAEQQDDIAKFIYQSYPRCVSFESAEDAYANLFVRVAADGYTDAVKYLYANRIFASVTMCQAFEEAAALDQINTVDFLNDTGDILPWFIGEVFVEATKAGRSEIVSMLCSKQSVPSQYLNEAFATTSSADIVKSLLGTREISNDLIHKVFDDAVRGDWMVYQARDKERIKVADILIKESSVSVKMAANAVRTAARRGDTSLAQILCWTGRIPAETINEALKIAVKNGYLGAAKIFGGSECITSESIAHVFEKAAQRGSLDVLQILMKLYRITPETATRAFTAAVKSGHTPVVRFFYAQQNATAVEISDVFKNAVETGKYSIVAILLHNHHVSQDMKNEALMCSARCGRRGATKIIKTSSRWWSTDVLEQAFKVAKDFKMSEILRRKLRIVQEELA